MRNLRIAIVVLLASTARIGAAATIFESGTAPTVHDTLGGDFISDVFARVQFVGVRFQITGQPVEVDEIGANMIRSREFGNNAVFAALIALSGAGDFPDSAKPLNTADVLRTTLITTPSPYNDDASGSFTPVVLTPGYYALFFGTNQFGATGEGQISHNTTPVGTPSFFFWNGSTFMNTQAGVTERYFVNGSVVPEPSMLGAGTALASLWAIGSRRR